MTQERSLSTAVSQWRWPCCDCIGPFMETTLWDLYATKDISSSSMTLVNIAVAFVFYRICIYLGKAVKGPTLPNTHTPPGCSLTSTGYLLSLASNSRHWCLHTRQSRDQPPLTSNSSLDPTHRPDLYAPLPLDVWHPPPVTPALLVHDCSLFWPHDGGMTFLWTSEQPRRCPRSNAD